VNFPDVLIVRNQYQASVPLPFVPGSEFAGVVRELGPGAEAPGSAGGGLRPGDRVFGAAMVGAFAQAIAVPAASLRRLPEPIGFRDGAAFWVTYTTAYHSLRSVAELKPGEWVTVLGAGGGVGLATVDVAVALGGRVLAAASSEDKLAVCRARGVEATVNYSSEDLKAAIRERTGGGTDVVVDPVGGPFTEAALRSTRWGGRVVIVGFASGEIPRLALNLVLLKGVIVESFEAWSFAEHKPDLADRDRRELIGLLDAGRLRPHVSATFPLDRAGQALATVAGRRAIGKVVIEP
jgi:NADPH2:quinone reductase